jgi:hypothetical protein
MGSSLPILILGPNVPTGVTATAGDAKATVRWTPPTSVPGIIVSGYIVRATYTVDDTYIDYPAANTARSLILSSPALVNSRTYTFTVQAVTQSVAATFTTFRSPPTTTPVVPGTTPGVPTNVTAVAGHLSAIVSWDAVATATGYTIRGTDSDGVPIQPVTTALLTKTISDLINGKTYTFTVEATISTSPTIAGPPGSSLSTLIVGLLAPTGVTATAGDAKATVRWTPPTTVIGINVSGYTVRATYVVDNTYTEYPAAPTARYLILSSPALVNGRSYTFTVVANTMVDNVSSPGVVSDPTTPVVPGPAPVAPTISSVVVGSLEAVITWGAVATATGYTIRGTDSDGVPIQPVTTALLTKTISGLINGKTYTFTVEASTATTTGPMGSSLPILILGPNVPTGVTATAGDAKATVRWTPPTSVPGITISGYIVRATYTVDDTYIDYPAASTVRSLILDTPALVNGRSYTFTVQSVTQSAAATFTTFRSPPTTTPVVPGTTPGLTTNVTAVAGHLSANVSWNVVATATGYTIRGTDSDGVPIQPVTTTLLTAPIFGLTNGKTYTFTVEATISTSPTIAGPPGSSLSTLIVGLLAPTGVTATAGDAKATVRWTPPTTVPGINVSGYTVRATYTVDNTSTDYQATYTARYLILDTPALVNGRSYTFTVVANTLVNNVSSPGVVSNPTTPVVPGPAPIAPTILSAVAAFATLEATITWGAVATATGYTIRGADSDGIPTAVGTTTTLLTKTIAGLTAGKLYIFTVEATTSPTVAGPMGFSSQILLLGPPTGITATAGNAKATVRWTAPVISNSNLIISSYTVTAISTNAGIVTRNPYTTTTSTARSLIIDTPLSPLLVNGTSYTFTVVANTASGSGQISDETTTPVVPGTSPGMPNNVTAVAGHLSAIVSWDTVATATSYTIRGTDSDGVPTEVKTTSLSTTPIFGLTNGKTYIFTVEASTSTNTGPPGSSLSTLIVGLLAPTGVTATAGDAKATVRWIPPTTVPGINVSGYTVRAIYTVDYTYTEYQATNMVRSLILDTPALVNGRSYTFTVVANTNVNSVSYSGVVSDATTTPVVPSLAPIAPTISSPIVTGHRQATISWAAVADTVGITVTGYIVRVTDSSGVISGQDSTGAVITSTGFTTTSTTTTITGLTNSQTYTFTVEATTTSTSGPLSSVQVIPGILEPTNVTATAGDAKATVRWTPSNSVAGITISGYTVRATYTVDNTYIDYQAASTARSLILDTPALVNGRSYTFTVFANTIVNSVASDSGKISVPTTPAVTPGTAPVAPTNVAGIHQVTPTEAYISWNAVATATGYIIRGKDPNGVPIQVQYTTTELYKTITGLTTYLNYTFTVEASNGTTVGPESTSVSVTPGSAIVGTLVAAPTSVGPSQTFTLTCTFSNGTAVRVYRNGSILVTGGNNFQVINSGVPLTLGPITSTTTYYISVTNVNVSLTAVVSNTVTVTYVP